MDSSSSSSLDPDNNPESALKKRKKSQEEHRIVEVFVYDLLEQVFKNSTLGDLRKKAEVSESWCNIAYKEIANRNCIESLILPITCDPADFNKDLFEKLIKQVQSNWHIADSLRSLPRVALLFHDGGGPTDTPNETFFNFYASQLENCSIGVIHSHNVSWNDSKIYGFETNLEIGITIPRTAKLNVNTYSPLDTYMMRHGHKKTLPDLADEAINNLITSEEEHSCFIILSSRSDPIDDSESRGDKDLEYSCTYMTQLLKKLKKRCKPGTYSLWGGQTDEMTVDFNNQKKGTEGWSIAVRLSGPAIRSWSIVIKENLSDAETEEKLLDFKKNIQLKSHSIAIAMIPANESEYKNSILPKTKVFRRIFSNISLIGLYNERRFLQFGVNSTSCDPRPKFIHVKSIAYLIISTE